MTCIICGVSQRHGRGRRIHRGHHRCRRQHLDLVDGIVQENGHNAGYSATSPNRLFDGTVWQENGQGLWWRWNGSTWPGNGTSTRPLPSVQIGSEATSATVSQSNISASVSAGNHMVLVTGSSDTLTLSGGTNAITDTGKANTYVLPATGKGVDAFTTNVLAIGDTLELRTAVAATTRDGTEGTLSQYLRSPTPPPERHFRPRTA